MCRMTTSLLLLVSLAVEGCADATSSTREARPQLTAPGAAVDATNADTSLPSAGPQRVPPNPHGDAPREAAQVANHDWPGFLGPHRNGKSAERGLPSGVFLAGYALARIVVEFFREPDIQLGFLLGSLTMGQLLSIPMLLAGLWLVARSQNTAARR